MLLDKKHSFRYNLESFFWVLFWIYIYYKGLNEEYKPILRFKKWNYINTKELAKLKKGEVVYKGDFIKIAEEYFTPYY